MKLLGKYNTLRNQILIVFLFVMVIVLLFVGVATFNSVSSLLKQNAEKQIQETAVQANGRIESLYQQIDLLSQQVATNSFLQQLFTNEVNGQPMTYRERQELMQLTLNLGAYSNVISSFEVYTNSGNRVIPLDEGQLTNVVDSKWIEQADKAKGKLVWVGKDPKDPTSFLALRRISLIERWFSNGGYLLMHIKSDYFQLTENQKNQYMVLFDQTYEPIASNYEGDPEPLVIEMRQTIELNESEYMLVKEKSNLTGWTLIILTPVSLLMNGISVLKAAVIFSGAMGFLIFLFFSYLLSTMITRPIFKLTKAMRKTDDGKLTLNSEISSTVEINQLNETYNELVEHTNHLIQVVYEKELIRSRTELKALQAQIDPHFLFNTLDSLYWSLEDKEEEELAELVIAMSELFRYTISAQNNDEWVTVKQELDHIERYMQIMNMRFGDRFKGNISVPSEYENIPIPKLLIQPLVENAILHGVSNKMDQGSVSVIVEPLKKSNNLVIQVKDNGIGMTKETIKRIVESLESGKVSTAKRNGMAIANVHKRLQLYYEDQNIRGISISSELNKGACITFEIPMERGIGNEKNIINRG
ncbi:cache domain-containing sensor histidine kinase [Bacillus taeanensis]|uniref:Sensor histidine kinase n=1 Tax=Bacillus taeanensis TaxID=273032 RepID=A0A366Y012_9BACI|nr:sensor histidine kinase [Bacillus taeanensis]RBW69743.1 sensor histidine kinase [Bacillus taeanensis]